MPLNGPLTACLVLLSLEEIFLPSVTEVLCNFMDHVHFPMPEWETAEIP